jgi:hypothetical protein
VNSFTVVSILSTAKSTFGSQRHLIVRSPWRALAWTGEPM